MHRRHFIVSLAAACAAAGLDPRLFIDRPLNGGLPSLALTTDDTTRFSFLLMDIWDGSALPGAHAKGWTSVDGAAQVERPVKEIGDGWYYLEMPASEMPKGFGQVAISGSADGALPFMSLYLTTPDLDEIIAAHRKTSEPPAQ